MSPPLGRVGSLEGWGWDAPGPGAAGSERKRRKIGEAKSKTWKHHGISLGEEGLLWSRKAEPVLSQESGKKKQELTKVKLVGPEGGERGPWGSLCNLPCRSLPHTHTHTYSCQSEPVKR